MKKTYSILTTYFLLCLLLSPSAFAGLSPADELRSRELASSLRCVVCEGQSLAESNAEIAVEMRQIIHKKIEAGESDNDILAWFHERYGDAILMRPPVKAATLPLWLAPPFLLLIGFFIYRTSR